MNNPLVSILVANYNNGFFFKDCYASILSQTYTNWEVVIVDDCSTDDSVITVKNQIESNSRFRVFQNAENRGCGFTKRKCVELAKGEMCGFLDPDDTLEPQAIQIMVEAHMKNKNCSIITSKYFLVDLELNKIDIGKHGESIPLGFSYLTYGKGALTAFATFKRIAYLKTDGINSFFKRAVDQDLYYKLEEVGEHFFIDDFLYNYRIHSNSISANENLYKARYWHHVAMKDAFLRRQKKGLKIQNLKKKDFKKLSADYFMSRFSNENVSNSKCKKIYFILKSIQVYPTYKLKSKIKKILLLIFK